MTRTATDEMPRFAIDRRETAYAMIGIAVLLAVPFGLAAYHLVRLQEMVLSGAWLGLHALILGIMLWNDGLTVTLRNIRGVFSAKHFLEIGREGPDRIIRVGFVSFGRSFITLQIPADTIRYLELLPMGKTMPMKDPWTPFLWHGIDAPITRIGHHPELSSFILATHRSKQLALARAQALLEFLAMAGIQMREFDETAADAPEDLASARVLYCRVPDASAGESE